MSEKEVGSQIKAIRRRNRLTQKAFAFRVGVEEVTVYRWEHGQPIGDRDALLGGLGKQFPQENLDGLKEALARAAPPGSKKALGATEEATKALHSKTSSNGSSALPDPLDFPAIWTFWEQIQLDAWEKLVWDRETFFSKSPAETVVALRGAGSTDLANRWHQLSDRDNRTNLEVWQDRYAKPMLHQGLHGRKNGSP